MSELALDVCDPSARCTATEPRRVHGGEPLPAVAARLEHAPAEEVVAWAAWRFGAGLAVASSFADCVLVDVVARVVDRPRVLFVDTGFHFAETLEYLERMRARYRFELHVVRPAIAREQAVCGTADCCALRKVTPMRRALAGFDAWITGLRRSEAPTRVNVPVVSWDTRFGLVKVAPLAPWTTDDVEGYVTARGLPEHPLRAAGYRSIGCAPTTAPVAGDEDPRAGRWPGQAKTECGLHV